MRNEIDPAATGRRIQEIRRQKGLRVTDISDYMGFLEPKAVYKWMRGDSLPTLQNMYQLSRLFGVTIDEIIQEAAGPESRGRGQEKGDAEKASPFCISGTCLKNSPFELQVHFSSLLFLL